LVVKWPKLVKIKFKKSFREEIFTFFEEIKTNNLSFSYCLLYLAIKTSLFRALLLIFFLQTSSMSIVIHWKLLWFSHQMLLNIKFYDMKCMKYKPLNNVRNEEYDDYNSSWLLSLQVQITILSILKWLLYAWLSNFSLTFSSLVEEKERKFL
jgi:hypothetical protein